MSRRELRAMCRAIHDQEGDAIAGERVIAQARDVGKVMLIAGTSSHRMREVVLRVNVLCVVDKAFRLREGPMSLREDKG